MVKYGKNGYNTGESVVTAKTDYKVISRKSENEVETSSLSVQSV